MAHWINTIDVKDLWEEGDFHKIAESDSQQLGKIKCTDLYLEGQREDLAYELRELAQDEESDVQDFDYVWNMLYDWADTPLDENWNGRKLCWIKTF